MSCDDPDPTGLPPGNKLSPDGQLSPGDDINASANPDFAPPARRSSPPDPRFPDDVHGLPHVPVGPSAPPDVGGVHSPSGEASYPPDVRVARHEPMAGGADPRISAVVHDPSTRATYPVGVSPGSHDPDTRGRDPDGVSPGTHAPSSVVEYPRDVSPTAHVPADVVVAEPVIATTHVPDGRAEYPRDVSPDVHSPSTVVSVDTGVRATSHEPAGASPFPAIVTPMSHDPDVRGLAPAVATSAHTPDTLGKYPRDVSPTSHDPDTRAVVLQPVEPVVHDPSIKGKYPNDVSPSTHSPSDAGQFPGDVKPGTHDPSGGAAFPGDVVPGAHDPSGDASYPGDVTPGIHDPPEGASYPGDVTPGAHDPSGDASYPGDVVPGTHGPSGEGTYPGDVTPGSHSPGGDGTFPSDVAPNVHDPSVIGADPGVATGVHDPAKGAKYPDDVDHRPMAPDGRVSGDRDLQRRAHLADERIRELVGGIDNAPGGVAGDVIGLGRYAPGATAGPFGGQGSMASDPRLYAKWLVNVGSALGASGLLLFAAEQASLFALNSFEDTRVWNPLYFALRAPLLNRSLPLFIGPPVEGHGGMHQARVARDTGGGQHGSVSALLHASHGMDARTLTSHELPFVKVEIGAMRAGLHQMSNTSNPRSMGADSQDDSLISKEALIFPEQAGFPSGTPVLDMALDTRNEYAPGGAELTKGPITLGDDIVDAILGGTAPETFPAGALVDEPIAGIMRKRFRPLGQLFERTDVKMGFTPKGEAAPRGRKLSLGAIPGRGVTSPLAASAFTDGIIPMDLWNEDEDNAVVTKRPGERPSDIIDDDHAYVPISFTDLRPLPGDPGAMRTVYFRPIIKSLSEDLVPEWDTKRFYGRVDPVATYTGTDRTINLAFELHAFAPEDVEVIYRKLNWLASMVYPEYDAELIIRAAPVVRLRVGDVISGGPGVGLPGIIQSFNSDFSEALWELRRGSKVPRSVAVSIGFQVLHDTVIGRGRSGKFGGIGYVGPDGKFTSSPTSLRSLSSTNTAGATSERHVAIDNEVAENATSFRGFGLLNRAKRTL